MTSGQQALSLISSLILLFSLPLKGGWIPCQVLFSSIEHLRQAPREKQQTSKKQQKPHHARQSAGVMQD